MPISKRLSNLAILTVLACAAVYVVALGTRWGLRLDREALPRHLLQTRRWAHAHNALEVLLGSLSIATMAIAGGAAIVVAMRRGRRDLAIAAAAILLGANLTTTVLKPLLAVADPLGGELLRPKSVAYPSGHATAVMSLALVIVLIVSRQWRLRVATAASVYVAAVGVALVAMAWHQPSDVVGGYLVAVAWAAGVTSVAASARERDAPAQLGRRLRELAVWAAASAAAAAAALLLLEPAVQFRHGLFAAAALIIAMLALLLPVALAATLSARPRGV